MKSSTSRIVIRAAVLTAIAMIAFAANSVLCRLALGSHAIDASSFTIVRLLSGTLVLMAMISFRSRESGASSARGSWMASSMLFIYAIAFSFAYILLDTGTGALIMFGTVQITMIVISLFTGNRLHLSEWTGLAIAFTGFVYLVLPGVASPSLAGFILMIMAGVAWGVYTLKGRGSDSPLMDTAYNFLRTTPFVIILAVMALQHISYSTQGLVLAILSGAIASGIGYMIWYNALCYLSSTQAAVVQLSVPVIAAMGGVIFMSEQISLRLALSSVLILGGILLVVLGRYYFVQVKIRKPG